MAIVFRISQIFNMPEYDFRREIEVPEDKVQVKLEHADFSWGFKVKQMTADEQKKRNNKFALELDEVKSNILTDINIDMKSGDFLAVVGQVGCGKTSLLYSIMDETIVNGGASTVAGSIAYVEQEPFIISDSVENNIRFG